jgi:hypothetical protein
MLLLNRGLGTCRLKEVQWVFQVAGKNHDRYYMTKDFGICTEQMLLLG